MSISDAQYAAWLADERNTRCLLVDIEYRSAGGTTIKDYLSTHPFVTGLADTPANTAYRCCVLEVPAFTQVMSDALRGYTTPSISNIVVDNGDGAMDAWISANFAGRSLTMYLGDPSWPKADFRAALTGVMAGITVQGTNRLTLEARARDHLLSQDVITTKYTSGGSDGKYKPLAYGTCYNVSPLTSTRSTRRTCTASPRFASTACPRRSITTSTARSRCTPIPAVR